MASGLRMMRVRSMAMLFSAKVWGGVYTGDVGELKTRLGPLIQLLQLSYKLLLSMDSHSTYLAWLLLIPFYCSGCLTTSAWKQADPYATLNGIEGSLVDRSTGQRTAILIRY